MGMRDEDWPLGLSDLRELTMAQRQETTDGRFVRIAEGEWWDTTGIDIVPETVVVEYMRLNRVGIVVLDEGAAEDAALH
jgi:hypothetical protein